MAKEKDANKSTSGDQSDQKTTPKKKGVAVDYLPERQKYEMLCRGEGIKMVKWKSQLCVCECVCVYVFVHSSRINQVLLCLSLCDKNNNYCIKHYSVPYHLIVGVTLNMLQL